MTPARESCSSRAPGAAPSPREPTFASLRRFRPKKAEPSPSAARPSSGALTLGKPVIACIQGFALGGGCELAMACTLRIAADDARFGQPEVKLGIMAGYGGTQRLPRLVGRGRALKLLLTGAVIDAQEALRIGLVEEVVPAAELMSRAETLGLEIAANAPLAVSETLHAVDEGLGMPLELALLREAARFGALGASADKAEGARAFLDKRPPAWRGE